MNTAGVLLAALLGGGGIGGFFTYLGTRRTDDSTKTIETGKLELEERRVDGETFDRAEKTYQNLVNNLTKDVERLRRDLTEERDGRAADNRRHASDLQQIREQHAAEMQDMREQLSLLKSDVEVAYAQLGVPGVGAGHPEFDDEETP